MSKDFKAFGFRLASAQGDSGGINVPVRREATKKREKELGRTLRTKSYRPTLHFSGGGGGVDGRPKLIV